MEARVLFFHETCSSAWTRVVGIELLLRSAVIGHLLPFEGDKCGIC